MRPLLILLITYHLSLITAKAWNGTGHMLTGAVAYLEIKKADPQKAHRLAQLLRAHPGYKGQYGQARPPWKQMEAGLRSQDEKDELVFMMAARWADDSRKIPQFYPRGEKRDSWHYINYAVCRTQDTLMIRGQGPKFPNLRTAYVQQLRLFQDETLPAARRAEALAWVMHLAGDAHQPLHTTNFFSAQFPKGDKGGNDFAIRLKAENKPVALHSYWDNVAGKNDQPAKVIKQAAGLYAEASPAEASRAAQKDIAVWLKESLELAKRVCYQEGRLQGVPKADEYPTSAPLAPTEYTQLAKETAKDQIRMAGLRLAAILKLEHGPL